MPGLDPGIHHSSKNAMDCRVKPGNDDNEKGAFIIPNFPGVNSNGSQGRKICR
jgi:hypothetical protein